MSERMIEGVRLSSPDKILYPEQGITKAELADYYVAVAQSMLPHVAFRPVTMVRCPTGRQKKCFYQRHAGSGVPKQLHKVRWLRRSAPNCSCSSPENGVSTRHNGRRSGIRRIFGVPLAFDQGGLAHPGPRLHPLLRGASKL